jgi:spermidine synthase
MPWMGHLPMLLDPDPQQALVICFGTGQTANAVRNENPQAVDVVDINPRVYKLAHNFTLNADVLDDPRVHAIVMDGRAYLRRTAKTYDIITLEPMPPTFAGVNALYDREFYQLASKRLAPDGVLAQWVPFHLMAPHYAMSAVKTFLETFPNALLWLDPGSKTGILVGSKDDKGRIGSAWPGFARAAKDRDLSRAEIEDAVILDRDELAKYTASGEIITDDNQLLSYGNAIRLSRMNGDLRQKNFELIKEITGEEP